MAKTDNITQDRLKQLLNYNPETGIFTWIVKKQGTRSNKIAGTKRDKGRIAINIDGILYLAHRLAWLYMHGEIPKEIDHINMDPSDNRIINLRAATHMQNNYNKEKQKNNSSGYKGVAWHKGSGKWQAYINIDGKRVALGLFICPELAHLAYSEYATKYHKEFARV